MVVMGVSGAGKTTIGQLLAQQLGWEFHDADDLHPPANIEKMRGGNSLTDADRLPWLHAVARLMRQLDRSERDAVLACSALKASYRRLLKDSSQGARIIFLHGPMEIIARRLGRRTGHFMHPGLLARQLETLEPPSEAEWVDAAGPPEAVVEAVRKKLGL
ncbi:MAG: gluconokinase [Dehalococcoidia bacterium]